MNGLNDVFLAKTGLSVLPSTVLTVTSSDDENDGTCNAAHCSLREAIVATNLDADTNTITFDIPGTSVHTIQPTTELPIITSPVTIDGTTQPGFAGTPVIELDGTNAGDVDGLTIAGSDITIKGLVINRFVNGIVLNSGSTDNTIQGNFIGTDSTGALAPGNVLNGILIDGASNNIIGGATAVARNVISGNYASGVRIIGATATNNRVQGNFIGTNAAGTGALGNYVDGVTILNGSSANLIGGPNVGEGNVISANNVIFEPLLGAGITLNGSANVVQGNKIGTDVTGTVGLRNGFAGIWLYAATNNIIGGTTPGAANIIAFNEGVGIYSGNGASTVGNTYLGNSIFSNTGLGINLGSAFTGVTPNDPGDADTGANNLQNFPMLTSATSDGTTTTITGTLNSEASKTYRLEFFANPTCDSSGYGEGRTYLGFGSVTTDANGDAVVNVVLMVDVPAGQAITATATSPDNNTSEFSACVALQRVVSIPPSLPNAAPVPGFYTTLTPTLSWNAVSWAVGYVVEVDDNRNFTSPDVYSNLPAGTRSVQITLPGDGPYYWRVRALNAANTNTAWSAPQPFRVDAP